MIIRVVVYPFFFKLKIIDFLFDVFQRLIMQEMKEKGETIKEEPKLRLDVVYKLGIDNVARVAKEGEKPNVVFGEKIAPRLYEL